MKKNVNYEKTLHGSTDQRVYWSSPTINVVNKQIIGLENLLFNELTILIYEI